MSTIQDGELSYNHFDKMKLLVLLLVVAVVGKVTANPRQGPYRQVFRMSDESEEDDVQDDKDESSEEWVQDDNPPDFSKVFPSVPTSHTKSPFPGAFLEVQKDIEKTGWKNGQKQHRKKMNVDLSRADALVNEYNPRWRAFRDDSVEDEEEDDVESEEEEDDAPEARQNRPYPGRGPSPYARRFRAGYVMPTQNRMPVSYAQRQPFYAVSPARMPMRNVYSYSPRRQMTYPSGGYRQQSVMPSYNYNRPPVSYVQRRQPVSMYDKRQFYQVPVRMSLPVRRQYQQSPVMRPQTYYRRPANMYRRQRQFPRYHYY